MAHFLFHATKEPIIVETEEYESLLLTGEWFDSPAKVKESGNGQNERKKQKRKADVSRPCGSSRDSSKEKRSPGRNGKNQRSSGHRSPSSKRQDEGRQNGLLDPVNDDASDSYVLRGTEASSPKKRGRPKKVKDNGSSSKNGE